MTEEAIQTDLCWIKDKLKKLDRIEAILDGNGKLGLCGRVNVLWYGHSWVVGIAGTILGLVAGYWLK